MKRQSRSCLLPEPRFYLAAFIPNTKEKFVLRGKEREEKGNKGGIAMDVTMNSYPTNRRFIGFTNHSSDVIHQMRVPSRMQRKAGKSISPAEFSHTGALNSEGMEDALLEATGGKKTQTET